MTVLLLNRVENMVANGEIMSNFTFDTVFSKDICCRGIRKPLYVPWEKVKGKFNAVYVFVFSQEIDRNEINKIKMAEKVRRLEMKEAAVKLVSMFYLFP